MTKKDKVFCVNCRHRTSEKHLCKDGKKGYICTSDNFPKSERHCYVTNQTLTTFLRCEIHNRNGNCKNFDKEANNGTQKEKL